MIVFQMLNPERESTRLDIFVEEPFLFSEEHAAAKWENVAAIRSPVLRATELIRLKRASGRPQDLTDVAQLEAIFKARQP